MEEQPLVETQTYQPENQPESIGRNLTIGIGILAVVIFLTYLIASSAIKSSEYKKIDLPGQNKKESVKGTAIQGPPGKPSGVLSPTKAVSPTPSSAPTTAPTSAPQPTATATPVPPTATPVPPTPDLTTTPTATPSGE